MGLDPLPSVTAERVGCRGELPGFQYRRPGGTNLVPGRAPAVAGLKQIDRAVDPVEVRALAEIVWTHCYFTGQYLRDGPDTSVAAEHAARSVVEFGEPSDLWLLEQARSPTVGPRALWALIDQRKKQAAREERPDTGCDEMVIHEVAHTASNRFGDGGLFVLESLHYWGHLWLLLGVSEQARRTANAIIAFPMRGFDRGSKILVLKLLTLGAGGHRLDLEIRDYVESTYRQLWPVYGYTPDAERADRQQIDESLERSGVPLAERRECQEPGLRQRLDRRLSADLAFDDRRSQARCPFGQTLEPAAHE